MELDRPARNTDLETARLRRLAAEPDERETAPKDFSARFAEGTPGPEA